MDNYCEPIINKDEFDALQIYNSTAPKEHYKPLGHFSKNRPMLSDMLYCGVCGKKAFLDRRKAKGHIYETYYCNDYHVGFRREVLDSLVIEKGIEILSDSSYQKTVQSITEGLKTPFNGDVDDLSIEAEIAKIDRKIARISDAIEDSDEPPATLVKRLADLEKKRAEYAQMSSDTDPDSADHILAEADRLRLSILSVLKNEKSTTDQIRNALSLFIHSVVIYPDKRVLIRHTLPGFAKVAGDSRQNVFAPLCNKMPYSQLFENWYTAV